MSVVLLAYDAPRHGSAWTLDGVTLVGADRHPLGDRALAAWDDADLVARVCVPLSPPGPARPGEARQLTSTGGPQPASLNGRSLGLGFLLHSMGQRLGIAPECTLACTGELTTDGVVHVVQGIPEKVQALRGHNRSASGAVARLLVPVANYDEARRALAGSGVEVVGVRHAAEAATAAFGPALGQRERAIVAAQPARAARRVLELAVGDHTRFLPWESVEALAASVVAATTPGTTENRHARVARDIAARHFGKPVKLGDVAWSEVLAEPPVLRFKLAAHFVQGANDGCAPDWRQVADDALALADLGEGEGELRVRGAVGRLLAAWARYDEACQQLERAVEAWTSALMVPETSIPACEWLRAARLWGNAGHVARAQRAVGDCLEHDGCSELSRVHLALALGRDAALAGEPQEAGRHLAALVERRTQAEGPAARWMAIARAGEAPEGEGIDRDLVLLSRGEAPGPSFTHPRHEPDWRRIVALGLPEPWRHWRY